MSRSTVLLALILFAPALSRADVWRWRDASGQLHYSNVTGRVPAQAVVVRTRLGSLSLASGEAPAELAKDAEAVERRNLERAIGNRLEAIDAFGCSVRARQLARLVYNYPNADIVPDWLISDEWLALQQQAAWLRKADYQLERRRYLADY